ncbi:hypothetical protein Misp01_12440 [Microtetraspora sp. NBRC 13810]|uniref:hypothetical protein n=1 Tax=Microtetraspora sp. NBRC 13810 TaxID=3030990 RepID=UPI0024A489AF|nr:hypothetical protein [Microtetraspora sp. NBRC 13810]GLW06114.1 hypothetical protein Misp01_12440 [Microtetraspora sp. NBRC 13810]
MNTFPLWPLVGLAVGIALGFAGAFGGWPAFVIVLVLGAAGVLIGRVMEGGTIDLSPFAVRRR